MPISKRRAVIDILADRSVEVCAKSLRQHPEIEVVSREGCGISPPRPIASPSLEPQS